MNFWKNPKCNSQKILGELPGGTLGKNLLEKFMMKFIEEFLV